MLTDEQKAFYAENGYVLVSRTADPPEEAAAYRQETHDLAERLQRLAQHRRDLGQREGSHDKPTQLCTAMTCSSRARPFRG